MVWPASIGPACIGLAGKSRLFHRHRISFSAGFGEKDGRPRAINVDARKGMSC